MALQHMWKSERVEIWVGSAQSQVSQRPGERDGGSEGESCQDLNPSVSHSFLAHRVYYISLSLDFGNTEMQKSKCQYRYHLVGQLTNSLLAATDGPEHPGRLHDQLPDREARGCVGLHAMRQNRARRPDKS